MFFYNWQGYFQNTFSRIELSLTVFFIYLKRQKLIEYEVRTLHNDLPIFYVQLYLTELSVGKKNFHKNGITTISGSVFVGET